MKAYTNLEQSKKLVEILPIESADMWYCPYPNDVDWYDEPRIGKAELLLNQLPCWSLAALLDVLPSATLDSSNDHHYRLRCMERFTEWYDNPVDACYEMILNLHEQKLL